MPQPNGVPTSLELRSCLDLIRRFCGLSWRDLAFRMGISNQWLSNLVTKGEAIRAATARDIREKALAVIETEFDPFYPPSPGLDREWFDVCQATKALLRAEVERTIPKPPEHLDLRARPRRRKYLD